MECGSYLQRYHVEGQLPRNLTVILIMSFVLTSVAEVIYAPIAESSSHDSMQMLNGSLSSVAVALYPTPNKCSIISQRELLQVIRELIVIPEALPSQLVILRTLASSSEG